ncbi:MAG: hypothetical protein ACREAM_07345 [Blastocatellia bacterium]
MSKQSNSTLVCDKCGAENWNLASVGKSHDQPANEVKGHEACSGVWRLPDRADDRQVSRARNPISEGNGGKTRGDEPMIANTEPFDKLMDGAENADVLVEEDEEMEQCAECLHTWPTSELEDGVCPDCLLDKHYESLRRREEYYRALDGGYEISDTDPGL